MDPEARPGGALTARPPPLVTQTCPWTAVGARMTTLAPATTPSPTTSHLADLRLLGRGGAERITWFGTLSDGRGLLLQTRTPREAPSAGSGEWDHKQALYPVYRDEPTHSPNRCQTPALVTPAGRLPGRPNSPSRTPHGPPRPVRRPECRPTPARRPRPASAHSQRLHRRQRAERAALSSRHTGPWPHAREAAHNLSRDAPPASQQLARHPQSAAAAPSPHWRGSPGR